MSRGLTYSLILHVIVFMLAVFGLPNLMIKKEPDPIAFSVEVLPISSISNVKPKKAPTPEVAKKDKPKEKPQESATPPKPKSEEKIEKPKEVIKKEPEKVKEKKEVKKEDQKKQTKDSKAKDQKKNKDELEDVEALLKTLEKTKSKTSDKKKEKKKNTQISDELLEELNDDSNGEYNNTKPLSMSEKDAIRNQIYKCWNVPVGTKDAENVKVVILLKLNTDGSVQETKTLTRESSDGGNKIAFRVVAESAIRAIHRCSPLENLPPNKYDSWKAVELLFDPSELIY
jgi:hypothetical protein